MPNEGLVITIRHNLYEVAQVYKEYYPKAIKSAAAIAMNRAMAKARTRAIKLIAARMGVPQKFVRDRVVQTRAHKTRLNTRLTVRGRPLNVARFGAQQVKKGLKHKAWKGSSKGVIEGGFLVPIKSPKSGLTHFAAHRPGGGRKLKGLWGPWPPQEFAGHTKGGDEGARPEVAKVAQESFQALYEHELNRQVDIINGKINPVRRNRLG
jgi:hypothetical protein